MRNVISLVKNDLLTLGSLKKSIVIMVIFGLGYPFIYPEFITFSALILPVSLILNLFAMEEKNKGDYLINSLPINKSDYIKSKYITTFCIILINSIMVLMIKLALGAGIGLNGVQNIDTIQLMCISILAPLLILSIAMPIMIKFSLIEGRIVLMIVMALVALGIMVFNSQIVNIVSYFNNSTIYILIIGGIILLLLISFFISSNLYSKKEIK